MVIMITDVPFFLENDWLNHKLKWGAKYARLFYAVNDNQAPYQMPTYSRQWKNGEG